MSMSAAEYERSRGLHPISDPNWKPPEPGHCWCGRPVEPNQGHHEDDECPWPSTAHGAFCDQHPFPRRKQP